MAIIYTNIRLLYGFFCYYYDREDKTPQLTELDTPKIQGYLNNYLVKVDKAHQRLLETDLEVLRAYDSGLTPDDLRRHNRIWEEDDEPEYTGVAYFIEKFLGAGSLMFIKGMVEDVGKNPEKAIELLDWVAESWPEWKQKIEPVVKKYQPIVRDMTETAAEAIAPIVDMPAVLLFGMSLRDEIKEQREFRADFKNMVNKVSEHFETKTEHIKSPEELELE